MKYIKPYNVFAPEIEIGKDESIESICDKYCIEKYTINPDGSIDVADEVSIEYCNLTQMPLKFNKVSRSFSCHSNRLSSLEGAPKKVGIDFFCSGNYLTSLEGGPKEVAGKFNCQYNRLTSVRGFPEDYEGILLINDNPIYEIFELLMPTRSKSRFAIFNQKSRLNYAKIAHLLNEYDVISLDGKKVYRDSIEEVFNVLGLKIPKNLKLNNYEIH